MEVAVADDRGGVVLTALDERPAVLLLLGAQVVGQLAAHRLLDDAGGGLADPGELGERPLLDPAGDLPFVQTAQHRDGTAEGLDPPTVLPGALEEETDAAERLGRLDRGLEGAKGVHALSLADPPRPCPGWGSGEAAGRAPEAGDGVVVRPQADVALLVLDVLWATGSGSSPPVVMA